jgi:ATP phosphoribosyltransferase
MKKLVLGLPKGSLQEATFEIMRKAGFDVQAGSRS